MSEDGFLHHFLLRADLAEQLYREGYRPEAKLVATVAIDALSAVWRHDFPAEAPSKGAARMPAFVRKFAKDERVHRIAVVLFAEDLEKHGPPVLHDVAGRLLDKRVPSRLAAHRWEFAEAPRAYLDCTEAELLVEEPDILAVRGVIAEYTYAALLYRLFRCSLAHTLLPGDRTSDFSSVAGDDDTDYFHPWTSEGRVRPLSLKIGIRAMTGWLRECAVGYVEYCAAQGRRPADAFEPNAHSLKEMARLWSRAI